MPGVPTGRACEGCRRQKKKCDEKQPACGRCVRLGLKCIGSGQQRFKFQAEKRYATIQRRNHALIPLTGSTESGSSPETSGMRVWSPLLDRPAASPPSSELSLLANAFTNTIKRSTDFGYNMWWAFGGFLEDVPRRLGTNEALDRAVDAITTAHAGFCAGRAVTVEALNKYCRALGTLREYLGHPVHALSSSTLGAVMILLCCQALLGCSKHGGSGHAEGAVQILRARRGFGPRDDFERSLFLSLRGVILFEGLFNDRIDLSAEEWKDLVYSELDSTLPDGRILQYLAQAPTLLRRARRTLQAGQDTTALCREIMSIYQACKRLLDEMKSRSVDHDLANLGLYNADKRTRDFTRDILTAHNNRTYGIGLTIVFFLHYILSGLGAHDDTTIFDADDYANEALDLAELSAIYRPLSAGYMIFCLQAAWTAATDLEKRNRLIVAYADFQSDFQIGDEKQLLDGLKWISKYLDLEDTQSPSTNTNV